MQRQSSATKHPTWVRLAFRLFFWVVLALLLPLLLGILVDLRAATSPWGLVCGLGIGLFVATAFVTRTIYRRFITLAPPTDTDKP